MTAFTLSPGLTPEIAEAFILELLLAVGVAHLLDRERGLETAVALNAVALAVVKLITDWGDLGDLPVGVFGVLGGIALLVRTWRTGGRLPGGPWPARALGALVLLLGAIKGLGDLYDPFDLTLGMTLVVTGLWVALRPRRRAEVPGPGAR